MVYRNRIIENSLVAVFEVPDMIGTNLCIYDRDQPGRPTLFAQHVVNIADLTLLRPNQLKVLLMYTSTAKGPLVQIHGASRLPASYYYEEPDLDTQALWHSYNDKMPLFPELAKTLGLAPELLLQFIRQFAPST